MVGSGGDARAREESSQDNKMLIEQNRIESLVINEGFMVNKVIHYMALIVKNEQRLILPFKVCCPQTIPLLFRLSSANFLSPHHIVLLC